MTQEPQYHGDDADLREYFRPIWERKWLIVAVTFVATAAVYFYTDNRPKVYSGSTKVFFRSTSVSDLANPSASSDPDRNLQNQATLLTSRDVATTVAKRENFKGDPGALLDRISAVPSSGSDFILLSAEGPTPREAAHLANAFAQAFIRIRTASLRDAILKQLQAQRREVADLPTGTSAADRSEAMATVRQLRLALSLPSGSAQQIDPARPPVFPIRPRPKRDAAFAFVLALLAAIALAYLLNRLDRRVRSADDVPSALGSVLALIPAVKDAGVDAAGPLKVSEPFREPFRQLRSNLVLAGLDRPIRKILVTSALPGEGKSTVVRNLALAYQEAGASVAVVDSDLRQPSQARLLNKDAARGFTDVLTGELSLQEALQDVEVQSEGLDTLVQIQSDSAVDATNGDAAARRSPGSVSLLASGARPANPQAVLAAERSRHLIDEIAASHDITLIDTSPVLAVSDVVPLLSEADAVVVVVRLGLATIDTSTRLLETLSRVPELNLAGVVMNGTPARRTSRYHGYGYRYTG